MPRPGALAETGHRARAAALEAGSGLRAPGSEDRAQESRPLGARGPVPSARGLRGFTLAELVMVVAMVSLLAAVALPTARFTMRREREAELRLALRQMRAAIDEHKRLADQGMIQIELGTEGYPKELEVLVEGVELVGQTTKRKFLRRIPIDPMTGETEWGKRSYQDEPKSSSWGGQNVYDVYSLSEATALDGTEYKDW